MSVYRDTMLKQNGGHYDKANAAYSVGGPKAAINMLNENLDLNIKDYVSVNFLALADVIDMIDGIDVDMTYEEVVHMNNYCVETSKVTGKKYKKIKPEVAGTYRLNVSTGGILCRESDIQKAEIIKEQNARDWFLKRR